MQQQFSPHDRFPCVEVAQGCPHGNGDGGREIGGGGREGRARERRKGEGTKKPILAAKLSHRSRFLLYADMMDRRMLLV